MTEKFRIVKLSKVLTHHKEFHIIDDTETYKRCRVQLHAKGIVLRDEIEGYRIKTKKQQFCQTGEFLVAEIDAKVGGFGIVPPELDGAIVSSHYFLFTIDEEQLDRRFLNYYIRTLDFREQVNARGSTNYAAIRPHHVLDMTIPLPPLSEQRRIVVKIEELTDKIEEARGLRRKAKEEAEALILSGLKHILKYRNSWKIMTISACSTMNTGTTPPSGRSDYYEGDLQWYTPGDLGYGPKLGCSLRTVSDRAITENKVRIFEPGTVLLVAIGSSLGKVGLAHERCSSNQQITGIKFFSDILPEYGFWWMRSLYNDLRTAASQATLPIINQKRIGEFKIAIPSFSEQHRIVAYLDHLKEKIDNLKRLQHETQSELDALIPSILAKAFKGEL